MNPVTVAPSSNATAAANGIAGLTSLTRIGTLAHPNRAWADSYLSLSPARPLAIAQRPAREFLTEARASVSVKGCGVEFCSVPSARDAQSILGERIHWPTRSSRSQQTTAPTTTWSAH